MTLSRRWLARLVRLCATRITCRLLQEAGFKLRVLLISQMKPQPFLGDHKIVAVYPPVELVGLSVQKPRSGLAHVRYRLGLRSRVQSPGRIPEASCSAGCVLALNGGIERALYFPPQASPVFRSENSFLQLRQVFQCFAFPCTHAVRF